jgi:hypothetical protein
VRGLFKIFNSCDLLWAKDFLQTSKQICFHHPLIYFTFHSFAFHCNKNNDMLENCSLQIPRYSKFQRNSLQKNFKNPRRDFHCCPFGTYKVPISIPVNCCDIKLSLLPPPPNSNQNINNSLSNNQYNHAMGSTETFHSNPLLGTKSLFPKRMTIFTKYLLTIR